MKSSKSHKILLFLLCLIFPPALSFAAGTAGTSGAAFLELGVGSRALGMGEAFTAETNDLSTIYYNPAGLGSMQYPMISVMHSELALDSRFENASFCLPVKEGYLGISNSFFWVPPFEKIDENGNSAGDVTFMNGAFTAAYGYDLEFMYIGASAKYIYQKIDTLFLSSGAIDVGLLKGMYMYSPFDAPIRNFHVGMSLLNLGSKAKDNPLPRLLRLGLSYRLTHWFTFNTDVTENFISPSDLYDFTYGFDESFRINLGAELTYLDILFLRGGWRLNDGGTYSLGVGFNYAIKNVAMKLDTSYSDNGIFGPDYSFTLSFKLIPKIVTYEDRVAAEQHYKSGIKFFVVNDLDSAIKEFKLTKDYDPYYKNIDRKIEDLKEIQALMRENEKLEKEPVRERRPADESTDD